MEQYLLKDEKGYFWIWYRAEPDGEARLNGPHSEPMISLPEIAVDNPLAFKPPESSHDQA